MKIKTNEECELVVPKIIEDAWKVDTKKYPEGWEDFYDWWLDRSEELFEPKNKNIFINKEIAIFIIDMLNCWSMNYADTGDDKEYESNTSEWLKFEDNGYRYSICAYGTTYNLDQFIGYKEKIIKKVVIKDESPN